MPRIVGEVSGGNPLAVNPTPFSVGRFDGLPTSMDSMGLTVGGDVPYLGQGLPRRLSVKFAIPAITRNMLNVSSDLQSGDILFVRKRTDQRDVFWIRNKEDVIDSGDYQSMRSVWGMSIRTLNKLIHQRCLENDSDSITPMSMAHEFVCAGVVHTDVSEQSDGSFRVIVSDWTNDNVQMRNIYTSALQADDGVGVLYTRTKIPPVSIYSDKTMINVVSGRKIDDVVCVIPYVVRPSSRWHRKNLLVAHRKLNDEVEMQPTVFSYLGSVIRRRPHDIIGVRTAQHLFRSDYRESTRLEFVNAAFDEEVFRSGIITNTEVRLSMI